MSLRVPTIGGVGWRPVSVIAAVAVSGLVLQDLRSTTENVWTEALFNFLHFPAFAAITWGLHVVARRLPARYSDRAATWTLLAALLLGSLSELLQIPSHRDASVSDLLTNFSGSVAMLLILTATQNTIRRWMATTAALALLLVAAAPLAALSIAYASRGNDLPVLVDFTNPFAGRLYRAGASRVSVNPGEADAPATATIEFFDGPKPGITFDAVWSDWRGFESLVIETVLAEKTPLGIEVHIFDERGRLDGDRFERQFILAPGSNVIRIPLDEVRSAPRHRSIDLGDIRGVGIFAAGAAAGRRFDLVSLRLAD